MTTNHRLMKFQQKCISKLKREDADFFLDRGTLKDMAICGTLIDLKNVDFVDDLAFDVWVVRYLQILMILSSASDDPRDQKLAERYLDVPFICEDIIKGRRPYENPARLDKIYALIRAKYPLEKYFELGGVDTETLIAWTSKSNQPMVNQILEYYSTPIVGVIAMMEIGPRDFRFLDELQTLLGHVLKKHYSFKASKNEQVSDYIKSMEIVTNFKLVRKKAA